jgi:hypothetical protein
MSRDLAMARHDVNKHDVAYQLTVLEEPEVKLDRATSLRLIVIPRKPGIHLLKPGRIVQPEVPSLAEELNVSLGIKQFCRNYTHAKD